MTNFCSHLWRLLYCTFSSLAQSTADILAQLTADVLGHSTADVLVTCLEQLTHDTFLHPAVPLDKVKGRLIGIFRNDPCMLLSFKLVLSVHNAAPDAGKCQGAYAGTSGALFCVVHCVTDLTVLQLIYTASQG